jgi:hypothetical protein
MKTTTEKVYIDAITWSNLDNLIAELQRIRFSTKAKVAVRITNTYSFGAKLECSWERELTKEEQEKKIRLQKKYDAIAKESRRQQWEELNKEFGDASG